MHLLTALTWLFIALVIYGYVGYPLLLWLLKKLIAKPVKTDDNHKPTISLIIAAYNEEAVITQKINNSLELDYPADKLQIMIVADGSTDQTAEIARTHANDRVTVLYDPPRRGKSAALNRGVEQATGEILVFSDANAYYLPDALHQLARNFADPAVGCVSGKKTVRSSGSTVAESEGTYWKYESFIKKSESAIHSTTGVVGEMNALRKSLYSPIPANIINDDAYLAMQVMRHGHRVIYEPEAISWETSSQSQRDEIIRRQRINAGRYQLMFQPSLYPWHNPLVLFMLVSHKFFRLLLPIFMMCAVIFNLLAIITGTDSLTLFAGFGQMVVYGLALIGYWLERNQRKSKLPTLIYYIVSSNGASLRGLMRYVRGQQSVLWEKAQRS